MWILHGSAPRRNTEMRRTRKRNSGQAAGFAPCQRFLLPAHLKM
jgi:hypothetical protein